MKFPPTTFLFFVITGWMVMFGWHRVEARLAREFVYCLERGGCRLESVCPFFIEPDRTRCFGESCTNLTGHIMALYNGLNTTIAPTWDVAGRWSGEPEYRGTLVLGPNGVRYFDTHVAASDAHTVRLAIEEETVDMVLAPAAVTSHDLCSKDQACDYLLRACYGLPAVDPHCIDYARHCHDFAREPGARGSACIQACFATHFEGTIKAPYELNITDLILWISHQQVLHPNTPPAALFHTLLTPEHNDNPSSADNCASSTSIFNFLPPELFIFLVAFTLIGLALAARCVIRQRLRYQRTCCIHSRNPSYMNAMSSLSDDDD